MCYRPQTAFVEFPPFKYADDDGNASGPWVEMTEKVAAEAGKIDVWPGVAGVPRIPELDLTGTPIFKARGAFIVSQANPEARTIIEEFDDAYGRLVERGQLRSLQ